MPGTLQMDLARLRANIMGRLSPTARRIDGARQRMGPKTGENRRKATLAIVFCALACDFALLTVVMSIFPT